MPTIKLSTEQLEITATNQNQFEALLNKLYDFNESTKKELTFANSVSFSSIDFSEIDTPFLLVLNSSEKLSMQINSQTFTDLDFLIINTPLTNLAIKNDSINDAIVTISIYGE